MIMMLQPNGWSCVPSAFAMAMDTTPKDMIDECGHDGSEILWPGLNDPHCRRGFDVQEMIDICVRRMVTVTPIVFAPATIPVGGTEEQAQHVFTQERAHERMAHYLHGHIGVLTGLAQEGTQHAVAWDGELCWDPRGEQYGIEQFQIEVFWFLG